MLIRFEAANFRSVLYPVELSMVAVDRDRAQARPVPNIGESLLTVAGVYGPNASGKTNILAALAWVRDAVANSLRVWDDRVPVEPFAFAGAAQRPTEFTVESLIDGIRFEYVVSLDATAVHYEGLFHYPEKKRRRVFEREGNELTLQRGLGNLSGVRELLTDRVLALSVARRFDEPLVAGFVSDVLSIQTLGRQLRLIRPPTTATFARWWVEDSSSARARALALLRLADLGIDDVVVEKEDRREWAVLSVFDADAFDSPHGPLRLRLIHAGGDERVPFDTHEESAGTQAWISIIAPVITAIQSGSVMLFDELESSLHPTLCVELLRLFHDPATNPSGAQLIFTSHDTSLLNHLNRDEVWLTEKLDTGATRLGALAEFAGERVRRSQNIEKGYLHGRFGALPDVDRTELLRALGLIG